MRKTILIAALALGAVVVPLAVWAASDRHASDAERQVAKWTTTERSTSSRAWRDVPGLSQVRICAVRVVTATLSATVRGAPVRFRAYFDTPEAPMHPGPVRFVPDGIESFSATFVREAFPFEADDTHLFSVQWRSPSGERVQLKSGVLHLLFQRGNQGCP